MARCETKSYSRFSDFEAAKLLDRFGAEVRIFDPSGLPLPDDSPADHPKVQELRSLTEWSEGQVWCSPERHGAMTGDHESPDRLDTLEFGAVRPTQGKTLAVMQVSGRLAVFQCCQPASRLRPLDANDHYS